MPYYFHFISIYDIGYLNVCKTIFSKLIIHHTECKHFAELSTPRASFYAFKPRPKQNKSPEIIIGDNVILLNKWLLAF